jgi:dihydroorotate dehydrogenase (NAD+) catalytic subunit
MYEGMDIFGKILTGLERFMDDKGYGSINEMVGIAHK